MAELGDTIFSTVIYGKNEVVLAFQELSCYKEHFNLFIPFHKGRQIILPRQLSEYHISSISKISSDLLEMQIKNMETSELRYFYYYTEEEIWEEIDQDDSVIWETGNDLFLIEHDQVKRNRYFCRISS